MIGRIDSDASTAVINLPIDIVNNDKKQAQIIDTPIIKAKTKDKRVPSFLHKFNLFATSTTTTTTITTTPQSPKKSRSSSPKILHSGNVQTLKQFWIQAFGSGNNKWEKSVDYSKCAKVKEKSATLGAIPSAAAHISDLIDLSQLAQDAQRSPTTTTPIQNIATTEAAQQISSGEKWQKCDSAIDESVLYRNNNRKKKGPSKSLDCGSVQPTLANHFERRSSHSDNFYKFKTASTIHDSQPQLSSKIGRPSAICPSIQLDATGKLKWARRSDIVCNKVRIAKNANANANCMVTASSATAASVQTINEINTSITKREPVIVAVECNRMSHTDDVIASANASGGNIGIDAERHAATASCDMSVDKNVSAGIIAMPQQHNDNGRNSANLSDCGKQTNNDVVHKTEATRAITNSEVKHSVIATAQSRKLGRNNSASGMRKYSFKTNSANFQRHSKKIVLTTTAGNFGGIGQGQSAAHATGKVASLANRFNQLVVQDKSILSDAKHEKKKIILHRTSGHIYKIREESKKTDSNESLCGAPTRNRKRTTSVKRKGSVKIMRSSSNSNVTNAGSGNNSVRAAIHQFEPKNTVPINKKALSSTPKTMAKVESGTQSAAVSSIVKTNKPAVPAKSAQVLLRTREIVIRNSLRNAKPMREPISAVAASEKGDVTEDESLKPIGEEMAAASADADSSEVNVTPQSMIVNSNGSTDLSRLYAKVRPRSSLLFPAGKKAAIKADVIPDEPDISEAKIVEAINSVNQRIESLSKTKSANCLSTEIDDVGITEPNDQDYQKIKSDMKPNVSFLFRPNPQDQFGSQGNLPRNGTALVEAVNNTCILKAQSMYDIRTKRLDSVTPSEDSAYEVIKPRTNESMNSNSQQNDCNDNIKSAIADSPDASASSCIYESIPEVKSTLEAADTDSVNSYESFENYETVDEDVDGDEHHQPKNSSLAKLLPSANEAESGYEICDPPTPPPPRRKIGDYGSMKSANQPPLPSTLPPPLPPSFLYKLTEIIANTGAKPNVDYESVKYSKIPPRPPKPQFSAASTNAVHDALTASPLVLTAKLIESNNYDMDDYFNSSVGENIYDTIKHREDALLSSSPTSSTITAADCYESIQSMSKREYMRMPVNQLKHSDSITTLSSDHKTNSLYGTSMLSQNITPPSEKSLGASSDNSDEWIDISDGEEYKGHKFVLIRKRNHRSPDWNRKVREQRMQQHNEDNFYDDSDHYYETLNQSGHAEEGNIVVKAKTQSTALVSGMNRAGDHNHHHKMVGTNEIQDDDYDSFDSDDEAEDENVKKNDSGVDVSLSKLPDPPAPTNQVYAIMQKINKNFGSLSKSLSKLAKIKSPLPGVVKHGDASHKQYENTHFYVPHNGNGHANGSSSCNTSTEEMLSEANKSKPRKLKNLKIPKMVDDSNNLVYENTEFHSPPITKFSPSRSPLPALPTPNGDATETKKNRKSGSSFRHHFRRSSGAEQNMNLGSSFNGKRSTFYVSNAIDADSGVFTGPGDNNIPPNGNDCDVNNGSDDGLNNGTSRLSLESDQKLSNSPRPINPPPPPPPLPPDRKGSHAKRSGASSWYAECGVFKANTMGNGDATKYSHKAGRNGNAASWYAEAGLYQTSGASVASSSGSSGVSTGGEGCTGDDNSHSMFLNEPLYQIYSAAKLESINQDIEAENHEQGDGYERISDNMQQREEKKVARPSALQLVGPKQGPSRTLWSEIPEVINSEVLSTLTPTEKRLQEAKFEILTSEASYLKSLTLLRTHFMNHPAFRNVSVLSAADRKTLFSFIVSVQECSDRLLCDLENCWQDNIMLLGLSQSVYNHADKYFHVYVSYCEHQGKLDRALKRLKEGKTSAFCQTLETLEQDPVCCGLSLHSFLMLPMQRITRLPLLLDAVLSKLKPDDDEFESWKMTLALLNKIVTQCNEAAKRSDQAFEMEILSRKIEFPPTIRPLAILPVGVKPTPSTKPRALIKRGELTHLQWRGDDGKLTFGKKFTKTGIYVFLFTDLIVLTKKRSDDTFIVFDYCNRSLLNVSNGDIIPQLPMKDLQAAGKHLIVMTLLENHENKMIEMIVDCPSETERQRWLQATEPIASDNPEEKLYEQWDCPQVVAKHTYIALQPDELYLDPGDIVNVSRKMADGWYQGERIRDGAQGWFPGNYTEEVESSHVRARNLKQRYRLLTISAAYWDSQKKK